MNLKAVSCVVLASAGLVTSGHLAGVLEADWLVMPVVSSALAAAVTTGAAVELRVPGLVVGDRRHASPVGFACAVVLYGLAIGAYWWVVLFVLPLTCLGVGGRRLAEKHGAPSSGRILSGLVALVLVLVVAAACAPGFMGRLW